MMSHLTVWLSIWKYNSNWADSKPPAEPKFQPALTLAVRAKWSKLRHSGRTVWLAPRLRAHDDIIRWVKNSWEWFVNTKKNMFLITGGRGPVGAQLWWRHKVLTSLLQRFAFFSGLYSALLSWAKTQQWSSVQISWCCAVQMTGFLAIECCNNSQKSKNGKSLLWNAVKYIYLRVVDIIICCYIYTPTRLA